MKTIASSLVLLLIACYPAASHSHYRPEQYDLALTKLQPITEKLTLHIETLENLVTELRNVAPGVEKESDMCGVLASLEIIENHKTRAWYNRLLLRSLGDIKEGISLGQMSTILRLSVQPLSNGIYQLDKLCSQTPGKTHLPLCDNAKETMRSLLATYNEAIEILKSAMMFTQDPS